MEHTESLNKIYKTKNYGAFQTIKGNRPILPGKVNKIRDSIKSGLDLMPYCPIIVDKNMNIIDGQHRFETCKRMQIFVHYVICDSLEIHQIARMNSATDKWSITNFLKCYIQLGNKDYEYLRDFVELKNVPISAAMSMLNKGHVNPGSLTQIKEEFMVGKFTAEYKDYAQNLAKIVNELEPYLETGITRHLLTAIDKLEKKDIWEVDVMIKKLDSSGEIIKQESNPRRILKNMEEIYNYHNMNRIAIW